jgi:IPT/TIG domain
MVCLSEPYVQLGELKKWNDFTAIGLKKSLQAGGGSASITVNVGALDPVLTDINFPNLICVNLDSSTKLWAGVATGVSVEFKGNRRSYSFTVEDMSWFLKAKVIDSYDPQAEFSIEDHFLNLKTRSDSPPCSLALHAADVLFTPQAVAEKYMHDAMIQLGNELGWYWWCDFGLGWNSLDTLYTQLESNPNSDVFTVQMLPVGETISGAPFDLVIPSDYTDCGDTLEWRNPKYSVSPPTANRVTVTGSAGDVEVGNIGGKELVTSSEVPADSTARHYPLLKRVMRIKQIELLAVARLLSFTPMQGEVGSTVNINGLNFTGATAVKFNGTAAVTFTVVNDRLVTAVVPVGATTGKITVETPAQPTGGGNVESFSDFTVI